MTLRKMVSSITLLVMAAAAVAATQAPQRLTGNSAAQWALAKRITPAVKHHENEGAVVNRADTGLHSIVTGRVEAKSADGRARVKSWVNNLVRDPGTMTLPEYFLRKDIKGNFTAFKGDQVRGDLAAAIRLPAGFPFGNPGGAPSRWRPDRRPVGCAL